MVLKKKIIVINGRKVEVEAYETNLVLGSGKEDRQLEELLEEDRIESDIKEKLKEIDAVAAEYIKKDKDIWYYYKIGKVLQFVNGRRHRQRGRIWERIANNLRPEVFFGKSTPPKNSKKYPEIMYLLAKQDEKNIPRVTWSHWFEILQYPKIFENPLVLENLLLECEKNNLSSEKLRKRVQELNRTL
jgi:hypothetical protein